MVSYVISKSLRHNSLQRSFKLFVFPVQIVVSQLAIKNEKHLIKFLYIGDNVIGAIKKKI